MGRPRYILQAWPRTEAEVEGILARGPNSLRDKMSYPDELRQFGWGMRSGLQPSVLPGGGLRIVSDRLSLSLERNGLLTLVAGADREYLAWVDDRRGRPNSLLALALIECSLEFVRFFRLEVLPRCRPHVDEWAISGGMADLATGELAASLHRGPTRQFMSDWEWQPASRANFEFGPYVMRDQTAGQTAFWVLREVYKEFGFDDSEIPYVADGAVSEDIIKSVKAV